MRDQTDSRTLPLPLPKRAMSNAERQAAWRARRAQARVTGVTHRPLVLVTPESVTPSLTPQGIQRSWVTRLAAGELNPYQQHVFRVRYGCDLFQEVMERARA